MMYSRPRKQGPYRKQSPFRGSQPRPAFRGRPQQKGERIDHARFISKAVEVETIRFVPDHAFADFALDERLKANITRKGYENPTPIQDKAIPFVLKGEDVVGIANTGTGKTAAFLLPLLDKILKNPTEKVLVVAPTRELALQIDTELIGFADRLRIFSVPCVGGAPIGRQIMGLKRKYNFVIGTPGRIKDLIEQKQINLSEFNSIVLDEADRMLDMGFIGDMRYLMEKMPKDRHTLFFTATLSKDIEKLIGEFLRNPKTVSVKTGDTAKTVEQDIVKVAPGVNKVDILKTLLQQEGFEKVLIFGRTKWGVEKLSKNLLQLGFKAESIHGNKNHTKRQKVLSLFKENKINVLVATDVAARGLDIAGVSHVINFDIPATYDDYVHRIGRTGRAGERGKALTFVE